MPTPEKDANPDQELRPQAPRLAVGAVGQIDATDPIGKAGIVLDPRARARLAAGSMDLDDQRSQSLRGRVDRRPQTRRPGTQDDQVVVVVLGARREARTGRQVGPPHGRCQIIARAGRITSPRRRLGVPLGRLEPAAVGEQRDRLDRGLDLPSREQLRQRIEVEIDPAQRHPVALQEVTRSLPQPPARDGQTASPDLASSRSCSADNSQRLGVEQPYGHRPASILTPPRARAAAEVHPPTTPRTMRAPPSFHVGPEGRDQSSSVAGLPRSTWPLPDEHEPARERLGVLDLQAGRVVVSRSG
jgi:mRNA-degrading endonuclease toxin of MazEF toxin-antitoxin module